MFNKLIQRIKSKKEVVINEELEDENQEQMETSKESVIEEVSADEYAKEAPVNTEEVLEEPVVEDEEDEIEYEIVEREIAPEKIVCPDCGGITLEGLEFCDKCGGEL